MHGQSRKSADRLWEVCAQASHGGYRWVYKYLVDIDDLSLVPKELSGRVSFKDVNLFNYISSGQPIAQIAPVPGKPGLTITNLKPMDPLAAEFPH